MLRTRPVINLVFLTVRAAERKEKVTAELQLHSDQGFQYISQMSRRGNPYDNALAEKFFLNSIYRAKPQTY